MKGAVFLALVVCGCWGRGGFDGLPSQSGTESTGLTYSYPLTSYGVGLPIFPNRPQTDGTGLTYSVTPALPTGLLLASDTGILDGTPEQFTPYADYTITAANGLGTVSTTLRFRVLSGGFETNSTADEPDANPGDGDCATVSGACTVRAALEETDALTLDRVVQVPDGTYDIGAALRLETSGSVYAVIGESATGTVLDGGSANRVVWLLGSVNVELGYLTVQNGSESDGGAVRAGANAFTHLHHCALLDNTVTGYGGAVYVSQGASLPGGQLRMDSCRVERNQAGQAGGAIVLWGFGETTADISRSSFVENTADYAGVIATFSGAVTIDACLFERNEALNGNGGVRAEPGRTLAVSNSTFVGNVGNYGSAFSSAGGDAFFNNTFKSNTARTAGVIHGGAIGDPVTLGNNVFVDNIGGDCTASEPDKIDSLGGNISDDVWCGVEASGDLLSRSVAEIALGSLGDHGGPTHTVLPQPGSIAIDAGTMDACTGLDQRGLTRPADGDGDGAVACDVGAVELQ